MHEFEPDGSIVYVTTREPPVAGESIVVRHTLVEISSSFKIHPNGFVSEQRYDRRLQAFRPLSKARGYPSR